jgi:hypothetical protein
LDIADFKKARALTEVLKTLPRDSAIFAAGRVLLKALLERWWEGRYLLFWVALEALFGPSNAAEVTYRLSQRLAFFLATTGDEAQRLFSSAKEGYGLRSKIVHGLRLQRLGKEKSAQVMYEAERLTRYALVKILAEPKYCDIFAHGAKREEFLDRLVFSGLTDTESA